MTTILWMFYKRKNTHVEKATRDKILWERLKLNLSPKTLFCKHIFWVPGKENELHEVAAKLKIMYRK